MNAFLEFLEFVDRVKRGEETLYLGCYKHKDSPQKTCRVCLEMNFAKLYCNVCKTHQRVRSFRVCSGYIEYVCLNGHLNRRVGDKLLKVVL
jgi:hypothetical protein